MFSSREFILFSIVLILIYYIKSIYKKRKLDIIDRVIGIASGVISILGLTPILFGEQVIMAVYIIITIGVSISLLIIFSSYLRGEKVKKKIGDPCKIKCGVQYYLERNDIPFEEFIRQAKKEIVFVSISHEYIQSDEQKIVSQAIVNRGVKVTVFVLDPSSNIIPHKEHIFGIGNFGDGDLSRGLKTRIENSLYSLCSINRRYTYIKVLL